MIIFSLLAFLAALWAAHSAGSNIMRGQWNHALPNLVCVVVDILMAARYYP